MIYLDAHATTPVDPAVLEAMWPYFTERFGNAASRHHAYGWMAEEAVAQARETLGKAIGATGKEIVFTSGATESINLAIKGLIEESSAKGPHIVTQVTEHKATLDTCRYLESRGCEVTYLPVDPTGRVDPEALRAALTDRTRLVAVMHGNNEIGTLQPIGEIGAICREKGVFFLVDAAQTLGKIPLDVDAMSIDLLAMSAHKLYGPKGVGALYVRRKAPRVRLAPQIHGGGHERGMRSGTLNVPGIVGMAKAVEIAQATMAEESARMTSLRDQFYRTLTQQLDGICLNGHPTERLPGNLNISIPFVESEHLAMAVQDVAFSLGSACTSASPEPSYVLRALGLEDGLARTAIRFGIGRFTTEAQIEEAARALVEQVRLLRASSLGATDVPSSSA